MPEIPAQYTLSADAPSPRTLIDILNETAARYPGRRGYRRRHRATHLQRTDRRHRGQRGWLAAGASAAAIGSGSGCRPAATRSTWRSCPRWPPARPMCRSTPTIPTNAPNWYSARPASWRSSPKPDCCRGPGSSRGWRAGAPLTRDDAWIIFTSGSTGTPKGVAVTHRNAAAFVDAEARMFLRDNPIGPGDRVLAGLSVAFDASCEEMWLAWRHGACLVPAPRSLVRSGMDLGPVAGDARRHRGVDGAGAGRAVARRGAGSGAAVDLRR